MMLIYIYYGISYYLHLFVLCLCVITHLIKKTRQQKVGQYLKKGVGNVWDVRNTLPAMFFRAIYIEPGIEARSTKVIFTLFVKTPKKASKRFTIGDKFYNRRQISNKFPKI